MVQIVSLGNFVADNIFEHRFRRVVKLEDLNKAGQFVSIAGYSTVEDLNIAGTWHLLRSIISTDWNLFQ